MDKLNHDVITKIINKDIDLFDFMNLDAKYFKDDVIFTEKYFSGLKRAFKRNSLKYHPDKCINASDLERDELENNFNLNQIIYSILSSNENYKEYNECKHLLSIKTHDSLKSSFKNTISDQDIKNLIKTSTNGKSYHELAAEKDKLHGINKNVNNLDTSKLYSKLLQERDDVFNNLKKETLTTKCNCDNKTESCMMLMCNNETKNEYNFVNNFNKQFDNKNLDLSTENKIKNNTLEIQPYNSISNALTNSSFDYQHFNYSDLYMVNDSSSSLLDESFKLLSADIPQKYENNMSLEDKIKEYTRNTTEISKLIIQKKND